jgi:very-short-patch-repair endonuclease
MSNYLTGGATEAVLERHRARRESGVPTVTTLVGAPAASLEVWRRWCIVSGRTTVCIEDDDLSAIAHHWAAAALDGRELVALVASVLSPATGMSPAVTAFRLRDERRIGATNLLDTLGSRGPLFQSVCEFLSAEHAGFDELWGTLSALARSLGSDTAFILSVLGELTGWSVVPSIALNVSSAEPAPARRLERSAAAAVTIVEAAPLLPVSICADASTWNAYERDGTQSHAKDVLSAGLVVHTSEPAKHEQHERLRQRARAMLAEAKARPHDREADSRARSVVEQLVYEALQTNRYTRDRFELNGTLDVFFGSRRLEVDLLDRAGGVALEIDGYYHFRDPEAYRRDRAKDLLMQRNGLFVVRALADDAVEALDELVARIVDIVLERRRPSGTQVHDG